MSLKTNQLFDYPFPKIMDKRTYLVRDEYRSKVNIGVYIDVFILDRVPEDQLLREKMYKRLTFWTMIWEMNQKNKWAGKMNKWKKMVLWLLHHVPNRYVVEKLNRIAQRYNKTNSDLYRKLTHYIPDEPPAHRAVFGDGIRVKFERGYFPIPTDYHFYLQGRYGNYNELPPKEKQIPHHDNRAYFKQNISM